MNVNHGIMDGLQNSDLQQTNHYLSHANITVMEFYTINLSLLHLDAKLDSRVINNFDLVQCTFKIRSTL